MVVAEDVARAHDDAVGRRAAHGEVARADLAQPQRIVQRQRMRNAGLVELGRHDPDVVGECARDLLDDLQPGRMDAVIIGAENSHPAKALFDRFRATRTAVLTVGRHSRKFAGFACKYRFCRRIDKRLARLPILRSRFRFDYFCAAYLGWRRGLRMTRLFAAAAISICFAFFIPLSADAQSDRDSASDNQCFPWQEFRGGHCVAKPSQAEPLPAPVPTPAVVSDPCMKDTRNLSAQCACPENTHRDAAGGACLADVQPTHKLDDKDIVCDGGTITSGACGCPTGFHLMAAGGNRAGGTCVRTNAENCLGGELTAAGDLPVQRPGGDVRRDLPARICKRQMRAETLPGRDPAEGWQVRRDVGHIPKPRA